MIQQLSALRLDAPSVVTDRAFSTILEFPLSLAVLMDVDNQNVPSFTGEVLSEVLADLDRQISDRLWVAAYQDQGDYQERSYEHVLVFCSLSLNNFLIFA